MSVLEQQGVQARVCLCPPGSVTGICPCRVKVCRAWLVTAPRGQIVLQSPLHYRYNPPHEIHNHLWPIMLTAGVKDIWFYFLCWHTVSGSNPLQLWERLSSCPKYPEMRGSSSSCRSTELPRAAQWWKKSHNLIIHSYYKSLLPPWVVIRPVLLVPFWAWT